MRLNFRQGLVTFQQSGGIPTYLQQSNVPGFVAHIISPSPTIITIAHGGSDYLVKFESTVNTAWQITAPVTTYLYWDIDQLTTTVTRGTTTLIPISSQSEPLSPVNDQHWFDLTENITKVWSSLTSSWHTKIRLFAGYVVGGNLNTIVQFQTGSQINLNTPSSPGYIMLDSLLQPLRKNSLHGEFLTDGDALHILTTAGTSGVLVQPITRVVPVRAGEAIPRMSMVYFSAEDTVRLASSDPSLIPDRPPVGMCLEALDIGEVGSVTTGGEVTYDQWNWSANIGDALYSDTNGSLTLTRPAGLMAFRVGFIKNRNTVLVNIDSETHATVYTVTTTDLVITGQTPVFTTDIVNGLGERVVTIGVPSVTTIQRGLMTAAQLVQLNTHETRIETAETDILGKANTIHTHLISDVLNLQSSLDGKSPIVHTHAIADVTNLQSSLDGKSPIVHTHVISDVTGLQTALDGKAFTSHTHLITNVTGLQTALDGKVSKTGDVMTGALSTPGLTLTGSGSITSTPTAELNTENFGLRMAVGFAGVPTSSFHITATRGTGLDAYLLWDEVDDRWKFNNAGVTSPMVVTLDDISNVAAAAPDVGDVLMWNSTDWVPAAISGGGSTFEVRTGNAEYATFTIPVGGALAVAKTHIIQGLDSVRLVPQDLEFIDSSGVLRTRYPNQNTLQYPMQMVFGSGLSISASGEIIGTYSDVLTVTVPKSTPMVVSNHGFGFDFGSSAHHNLCYRCTSSGDVSIVVQADSFWTGTDTYSQNNGSPVNPGPMPIGGTAVFGKHSTGNVIFVAAIGVTINYPDSLVLGKLHGKATLIKVAANEYDLEGHLDLA